MSRRNWSNETVFRAIGDISDSMLLRAEEEERELIAQARAQAADEASGREERRAGQGRRRQNADSVARRRAEADSIRGGNAAPSVAAKKSGVSSDDRFLETNRKKRRWGVPQWAATAAVLLLVAGLSVAALQSGLLKRVMPAKSSRDGASAVTMAEAPAVMQEAASAVEEAAAEEAPAIMMSKLQDAEESAAGPSDSEAQDDFPAEAEEEYDEAAEMPDAGNAASMKNAAASGAAARGETPDEEPAEAELMMAAGTSDSMVQDAEEAAGDNAAVMEAEEPVDSQAAMAESAAPENGVKATLNGKQVVLATGRDYIEDERKVSGNIISIHVADAGVSDPSEMTTYSDVISLGFMAGLVNSADRAEFITAGEAAEQSGRDSIEEVPEIGRLYMDLKDGSQLELRLLEGGYVYFPEIPEAALILPENAMATVQNLMGN